MNIHGTANESRWYGGRHPRELTSDEFMGLHRTGYIPSNVYEQYRDIQGLAWLGAQTDYPVFVASLGTRHGEVALRQRGERNLYVAHDANGEILRDGQGLALYLSEEEVGERGWAAHDQTIVAFFDDVPIGLVSNEWGAVGAWVAERYQRCGIGTALVRLYLEATPSARLGQMTTAGAALARAVHRSFVESNDANPRSTLTWRIGADKTISHERRLAA